jgi:ribosomal protein S8
MFKSLNGLLYNIKNGANYRLKYIKVLNTLNNRILLNLLYKKGLINNYCFSNNLIRTYLIIELKYNSEYKHSFDFKMINTKRLIKLKTYSKIKKHISYFGNDYLIYHNKYGLNFLSDLFSMYANNNKVIGLNIKFLVEISIRF